MTAGRLVRRLLVVALVAAFVVACLRLGWWQWQRYHSSTGSAQNLGYTLQWPTFALFALFMWWRLSRLEAKRKEQQAERAQTPAAEPQPATHAARAARPVAQPDQPDRANQADQADDELAAYNRYLAQLHAKESDSAR